MGTIWTITGIAVPTLAGLGFMAMSFSIVRQREFFIARSCFWLASLILIMAFVLNARAMDESPLTIRVLSALVPALIVICAFWYLLNWANEREQLHGGGESRAELRARQKIVLRLQELSEQGFALFNRCYDCDVPLPSPEITEWNVQVIELLRREHPHLEYNFRLVEDVPQVPHVQSDVIRLIPNRKKAIFDLWPKVYQLKKIVLDLTAKLPILPKFPDVPPKPIQIRDLLDQHIVDGKTLVKRWMARTEDPKLHKDSLMWLSLATSIVKNHLSIKHVDELDNHFLEIGRAYIISLNVPKAGDWDIAIEIGGKVEVLEKFRRDMS